MSLFSSLTAQGAGEIWSLSGISFASPVNDLLECDNFTLEQLLEVDELLQEIKSKNERLLEFLCQRDVLEHLLEFIIQPVSISPNTDYGNDILVSPLEMRTFKYPYISCEIICSEVPQILNNLVEEFDCALLDKLFSFLSIADDDNSDEKNKLDYYLSGYFEKILEMLFRRMTVPMMRYFNAAGITLFKKFLHHIDNYSIMQIVQRLMLPHIPFSNSPELDTIPYEEIRQRYQCHWSYLPEACKLLFDKMFDVPAMEADCGSAADIPLHVSDLLITVLQLSPPETLVIKFLCEPACINKLLFYACWDPSEGSVQGQGPGPGLSPRSRSRSPSPMPSVAPPPGEIDASFPMSNISLSAISVLESLISRLFESSLPMERVVDPATNEVPFVDIEAEQAHIVHIRTVIESICVEIVPYISQINAILRSFLSVSTAAGSKVIFDQSKRNSPRLGHRGLQLVKFIESVVRVGVEVMDVTLCENDVFKTCLQLFFKYESNSLLHLSVQRILIHVIEGDQHSRDTQLNVLVKCDLLRILRKRLGEYEVTASPDERPGEFESVTSPRERAMTQRRRRIAAKHSSLMGSMVLIAQAAANMLDAGVGLLTDVNTSGASGASGGTHGYNSHIQLTLPNLNQSRSPNFQLTGVEDDLFGPHDYEDAIPELSEPPHTRFLADHPSHSHSLFESPTRGSPVATLKVDEFETKTVDVPAVVGTILPPSPPHPPNVSSPPTTSTSATTTAVSQHKHQLQPLVDDPFDTDDDVSFHSKDLGTAIGGGVNPDSLRAYLLAHTDTDDKAVAVTSTVSPPDLTGWDSFVEGQLRHVLKHQVVGSYQTSSAAAAAAAKGLGVSLFGNNNSGDLITTDIGNFNDDFMHLGLSFDDGLEHADDEDDDVDEFDDYDEAGRGDDRDNDFGGTGGYSNYRTMSRSRTMGNLESNVSNSAAFVSYRDSYNFQPSSNGSAIDGFHSPESPRDRHGDEDEIDSSQFMDTINFAEFANFDSVNITDGMGGDMFSSSNQAFAAVLGQQSQGLGKSSMEEVDCFADFEDVDFSQDLQLGAGTGLGVGAVNGAVSPLEMDLLTAATAEMAISASSRNDMDM
eukprot:gene26086-34694_t